MTKLSKSTSNRQNCNPLLCIVAGGSGGHILPALQLAHNWLQQHRQGNVVAFCSHKKIDQQLFNTKIIQKLHPLKLTTFSTKKLWTIPLLLAQLFYAFCKTSYAFFKHKPIAIIATGGIEALPVCLAGKLFGIPIKLYELNAEAGKAAAVLAPLATEINVVFPQTQAAFKKYAPKTKMVAYPLRFTAQDKRYHKEQTNKKTLLVLGGSQGSVFLNKLMQKIITQLPSLHIIHQAGNNDITRLKAFYASHNVSADVFSFDNNIKKRYQQADVVLCRAGAGTLFELIFFEKKAIVIPLNAPTTQHQFSNARAAKTMRPDLFSILSEQPTLQSICLTINNILSRGF